MKLINRYVLRSFIRYLLLSLILWVFIYIVIDLFEDLGKFLAKNVALKDIVVYYIYLAPSYIVLLIPVAAMMAVFFVFGFMTKNGELTALKASGFDINKLFKTILTAGVVISAGVFIFQETVGVWAQRRMFEHKQERIDKRPRRVTTHRRNFFYYGEDNWVYYIKDYDADKRIMSNIVLWKIVDGQKVKMRIDVELGYFDTIWKFQNGTMREFDSLGDETVNKFAILEMPELKEKPEDFMKRIRPVEEMNFLELYRFIRKRSKAGEYIAKEAVEFNYRFSFPVITIIVLLITLPFSVVLKKGGIAIGVGSGIGLAFAYWGAIQSSRAYGVAGIVEPFLAAWIPNAVFALIGILMMWKVPR